MQNVYSMEDGVTLDGDGLRRRNTSGSGSIPLHILPMPTAPPPGGGDKDEALLPIMTQMIPEEKDAGDGEKMDNRKVARLQSLDTVDYS